MATYDPFRDFDRLASSLLEARRGPRYMPMDLYRDGDHYVLTADLPGIDPGSVDISAGSPDQSSMVNGLVNARYISSGCAGMI